MAANASHLPLKTAPGMSRRFPIIDLLRNLHLKRRVAKIDASPLFDAGWYLNRYPDVRQAEIDPALHYVRVGADESRNLIPFFDSAWYASRNLEAGHGDRNPLVRHLQNGNRATLACRVAGWGWWLGELDEPVEVEIWINEELAGTVPELERRPGLCHLLLPRGRYVGFHLPAELKSGDKVRFRVARTGQCFPAGKAEIFR